MALGNISHSDLIDMVKNDIVLEKICILGKLREKRIPEVFAAINVIAAMHMENVSQKCSLDTKNQVLYATMGYSYDGVEFNPLDVVYVIEALPDLNWDWE
jgi:hypothetical protein